MAKKAGLYCTYASLVDGNTVAGVVLAKVGLVAGVVPADTSRKDLLLTAGVLADTGVDVGPAAVLGGSVAL